MQYLAKRVPQLLNVEYFDLDTPLNENLHVWFRLLHKLPKWGTFFRTKWDADNSVNLFFQLLKV